MISNCCRFCLSLLLLLLIISCGENNDSVSITLSGIVSGQGVAEYPDKPILVAVLKGDNTEQYDLSSLDNLVKLISVDKKDFSFQFDMDDTELDPGDVINLLAFVDVNAAGGVPLPDAGDFVGLYVDKETFSSAYVLQNGHNTGFEIQVNRVISPHKMRISGNLTESPSGDVTIVAYAGEINSLEFSDFRPDDIIAYSHFKKEASVSPYQFDISSYPYDLNVDYFYIMAFLDENGSGIPSPGNIIGFHVNQNNSVPELIQIDTSENIHLSALDIQMRFPASDSGDYSEIRIPEPSGDIISLIGQFELPEEYAPDEGALFLIVAETDTLSEAANASLTTVRYFQKIPQGENIFAIDLSQTGLSLADEVMVMALWDRDYQAGFPMPTQGDMVGFLQNKEEFTYSILLSQWQDTMELLPGWDFSVNRRFYDHQASVLFEVNQEAPIVPQAGDPLIAIAVAADGVDLLDQTIDADYIVGMTEVITDQDGPPYSLQIFPAIYAGIDVQSNPFNIMDVYLIAVLDNSPANGRPDSGEYIGYHGSTVVILDEFFPLTFDIEDNINTLENGISFTGNTY